MVCVCVRVFRSACVRGVFWRLWTTMQWGIFSAAAASMFAISLVSDFIQVQIFVHYSLFYTPSVCLSVCVRARLCACPSVCVPVCVSVCVQVPYTYLESQAHSNLWPGVRKAFESTNRFPLVNSYGLFRRMTGVGGRPEVIIEGSVDGSTWTVSTEVQTRGHTRAILHAAVRNSVYTVRWDSLTSCHMLLTRCVSCRRSSSCINQGT